MQLVCKCKCTKYSATQSSRPQARFTPLNALVCDPHALMPEHLSNQLPPAGSNIATEYFSISKEKETRYLLHIHFCQQSLAGVVLIAEHTCEDCRVSHPRCQLHNSWVDFYTWTTVFETHIQNHQFVVCSMPLQKQKCDVVSPTLPNKTGIYNPAKKTPQEQLSTLHTTLGMSEIQAMVTRIAILTSLIQRVMQGCN